MNVAFLGGGRGGTETQGLHLCALSVAIETQDLELRDLGLAYLRAISLQ